MGTGYTFSIVYAAHYAKDVVVDREDTGLTCSRAGHAVQAHVEVGSVNAGEVEGTRWLVLLGLEGEGIDEDTGRNLRCESISIHRDVLVVLERLDQLEIVSWANIEAVLAVELDVSRRHGGSSSTGEEVVVPVVGVSRTRIDHTVHGEDPHQFLHGMVVVELDASGGAINDFITGELELLNEVLV